MKHVAYLLIWFVMLAGAQAQQPRATFEDYPTKKIYTGPHAKPILGSWSGFRTRIREGAKQPVNFAGHYVLTLWGCGTSCVQGVAIDSITGKIYEIPFSVAAILGPWEEEHPHDDENSIVFKVDSRLIRFNACPNEHDCGFYDYEMVEGKGLKLVHKEVLPKKYQLE